MTKLVFGEYYKPIPKVVGIEAPIVGIVLVVLFIGVLVLTNYISYLKNNHMIQMIISVLLSGMIFHILCEYTGVNVWYSKDYCEIIQKTIPKTETV